MFRHKGKFRTFKHNLRLASLLSFIAGLVNVTGLLGLSTLTTNVTGHFAFFADEMMQEHYKMALTFLFFIFSFLSGAFTSSLLTEFFTTRHYRSPFIISMLVEVAILLLVSFSDTVAFLGDHSAQILASILLFAMGIQNSLVTQISNATVRTTHLTGLFTDLGIELGQWFFYRSAEQRGRLRKSLRLRLAIISFFFLGCFLGGFCYRWLGLRTLTLAGMLVLTALFYDMLRLQIYVFLHRKK